MRPTWMVHRFRSAFFRENLLLLVLGLLRESELSEWELLNLLYSRYEASPSAKEFRKLLDALVNGGYAGFEWEGKTRRLRLSQSGIKLLLRLEEERRAIVADIDALSGAAPGRP